MKLFVYIIFFILFSQLLYAQDEDTPSEEIKTKDTTLYQDNFNLKQNSPVTDSTNFELYLSQNPTKALFKSMFVPGWGQYGNKKKFKALLYLSFDIWMISKAIDHKKQAQDLWDKFDTSELVATKNYYYDLYTQERNRRNKYTWYAVITSFISMFDAYVDAHLSGIPKDKNQKFSFDIQPMESNGTQVSLSINF